ncbi:LicD family protein [uncultured Draconibacterium sp.]|uniref:LicD family protein n=1 Tax=uncultured Draconibacterium sp. TaxID=1573823 RepID=UPI0029C7801D|nr:LicD family protein [uncultured Draconibacterium sp.]
MNILKTPSGNIQIKKKILYLGIKQIDKKIAKVNLLDFKKMADNHKLNFYLYKGTLLGAIRDNDFIEHDEDIDLMIMEEEKEKFFNLLYHLQKIGFDVVRYERRGIISIMRNNEYIDFYIFKKYEDKIRACGNLFIPERFLLETTHIRFQSAQFRVPKDYKLFLRLQYGENWSSPIQYANFNMSFPQKLKTKVYMKSKDLLPKKIFFKLLTLNAKRRKILFDQKVKSLAIRL